MADLSIPARDSVAAQQTLFERAAREHGLSISVIAQRNQTLNATTMRGWRDGSAMPAWALGALGDAGVPDELLSLITEPWSRFLVTECDDDGDLDTAAADSLEFATEVQRAHHPNSPGGLAIVPQERAAIEPRRRRAAASLRRAAA